MLDNYITIRRAATLSGVPYMVLYRAIQRRELKATKLGQELIFHIPELNKFIDYRRQKAGRLIPLVTSSEQP